MSFKLTVQLSFPTVTRGLIAAGNVLFITCSDKLTNIALWAQCFMCLSSHFQQQAIHNMFVNFIHLQYVFSLTSTSKSLAIHSHLTLHICYYIMF
jgi:hypothetical protein